MLAADGVGQGRAELVVVGREPVSQELQQLGDVGGVQGWCSASWSFRSR